MEMIDELIRSLFDNAEMTLDMLASGTPIPIFLGKGTMSCVDGTQLCVELVLDEDYLMGHSCLFFRFIFQSNCLLEPIPMTGHQSWFEAVQSDELREKAKSVLSEFKQMNAGELEQFIREDGMAAIYRMLLSAGRLESSLRVPASCFISAFGEVFQGVSGLNEYCKCQSRKSSPYIIRKTSLIEAPYEHNRHRFDYLICRDSEDAECWMNSLFARNLGDDSDTPPFITYVEGTRYMTIH